MVNVKAELPDGMPIAEWTTSADGAHTPVPLNLEDTITLVGNVRPWLERLRDECDRLEAQLPEGMKHCTILFKECPKGHGWLTATNWVQHDCPWCERDELIAERDEAREGWQAEAKVVAELQAELNRAGSP